MLVSWGLIALLAAGLVVARPHLPLLDSRSLAAGVRGRINGLDIFNNTELDAFIERYELSHSLRPSTLARSEDFSASLNPRRTKSKQRLSQVLERDDGCPTSIACAGKNGSRSTCEGCSTCCPTSAESFQCGGQGLKCCLTADGAGSCCPDDDGACNGDGCPLSRLSPRGISTVFATSTVVHTITKAAKTGANNGVVISTVTETLTFIDTGKQTETATITVTSFLGRAKRTARSVGQGYTGSLPVSTAAEIVTPTVTLQRRTAYDPLETQLSRMGVKVIRQAQVIVTTTTTTTITVDITTTVVLPGPAPTSTRFNTVFVTITIAPNAVTTVFTTTTIFVTGTPPVTSPSQPPTGMPTPAPPAPPGTVITSVPPPPGPTSSGPAVPTATPGTPLPPVSSPPGPSSPVPSSPLPPPPPSSATGIPPSSSQTNGITNPATMVTTSPPEIVTPTPPAPPRPSGGSPLSSDVIAGIALGVIFGLFALLLAAFFIRKAVQKRRSKLAAERQQLTPPSSGPVSSLPGGGVVPGGSSPRDPNEVRIVIKPAPKGRPKVAQRWPMPPGHNEPHYSMFIEGTTGETTPAHDQRDWSVVSDFGGSNSPEPSGPATRRASGVPSSGIFPPGGTSTGIPLGSNALLAGDGQSTEARSTEGRPSISSSAPATRLQPPPAAHGTGRGPYNFGSWGVGRAL